MPPARPLVALLLLAVVLGACGSGPEPASGSAISPPRPTTTSTEAPGAGATDGSKGVDDDPLAGWSPAPLAWQSCGLPRGGQCADLEVPLDWSDPAGATIELRLGRLPATGDRLGSLLTNPGGPGGSGLQYLGYDPFSIEVNRRFDVLSWDPRGVGDSDGLVCGADATDLLTADPDPDDPGETAALEAAAAAIAAECARSDAEVLAHLSTEDVARDLEALRRALGAEPLNYVGFSYGTHIGQEYARMFPGEIRTMVLDGVVDPALGFEQFLLDQTEAFDAALERGAQRCAAAGPASCGVADLLAAYDEVATRVESAPLGGGGEPVGPGVLATAAISTSYVPDGWRDLGPALAAALDGDGSQVWQLAAQYFDFGSYGSYAAVVCTDSPPPRGPEDYRRFAREARAISPRLGGSVANEMLPCATWPAEPVGRARPIEAPGTPPILVVGSTGDAATPYDNAVAVADRLARGVLVTVNAEGHTAYGTNLCASEVVDRYLVDLVVPDRDPDCG